MIGAGGTLGSSPGSLHTLPDYTYKYTGQLYFANIQDAASAIYPIKQSGARREIMDRKLALGGEPPWRAWDFGTAKRRDAIW